MEQDERQTMGAGGGSSQGVEPSRYDRDYYDKGFGPIPYDRGQREWMAFFGTIADRIVAEIKPARVLDVGCAKGLLVEALRDRRVEAFGIDVSDYAIGEVREDIRPYCRVASALDSLEGPYDLIVCIEVLEHLTEEEGRRAIANLCRNTDDILFSSTPDDFTEPTHVNVRPQSYWIARFLEHGFALDPEFDAEFVAPHAMRFKRGVGPPPLDGVLGACRRLRREVRDLGRETQELRRRLQAGEERVADLTHQLLTMQQTVGWKLLKRALAVKNRLCPPDTARGRAYWAFRRAVEVLLDEGGRILLSKLRAQVGRVLRGRGFLVRVPPTGLDLNGQYRLWLEAHPVTPDLMEEAKAEIGRFTYRPLISIVTPVYNTDEPWLRRLIESVQAQLYPHWEFCLADDASTRGHVRRLLDEAAAADPRIKVRHLERNEGIVGASARALAMATGEFVGLLDHDDELSPDALYEVVKRLNREPDLDFLYSDEDKLEPDGRRVEPFFKPGWSPELLLAMNYITHFSVFRRSKLAESGGFRAGFDGSQDYDLILRFTERTDRIAHIPKVLYHWRKIPGSAASSTGAKPYAYEAARKALAEALARRGLDGTVEGDGPGRYRVRYRLRDRPLVSIVIPTRDRRLLLEQCLSSLREKTDYAPYEVIVVDNDSRAADAIAYLEEIRDRALVLRCPGPFNFSAINNLGASRAAGRHLLFLNNDTQAVRPDWLTVMVEQAEQPGIGAVGAKLLYPDRRIQHAGIVLGVRGFAAHAFKHQAGGRDTYYGFGETVRNCSAVTAACLLVPRGVFEEAGGFDERLPVAFNDVDLCLRIRQRGYRIVYTPKAELLHYESATRGGLHPQADEDLAWQRWGDLISRGDPYYNRNLTLSREDWSLHL